MISVLPCVLFFQMQPFIFLFYFTATEVKCRVVIVKRLPILHHSADYIYLFTLFVCVCVGGGGGAIIEPILVTLKMNTTYAVIRDVYVCGGSGGGGGGGGVGAYTASQTTLHKNKLDKLESPIFVLSCVLCFQRRPFRFLLYFTTTGVKCCVSAVKPEIINIYIYSPIIVLWFWYKHKIYLNATATNVPSTCSPSEDLDQPVHSHSLIKIFTGHS